MGEIGSPPINLLAGEAANGGVRVGEVNLPFEGARPGKITLGIRPEAVRLGNAGHAAKIGDLEPHGRETIYHLDTPLGPLRALEAGAVARFRVGDEVRIEVERALVFAGDGRLAGDTTALLAA